MKRLRLSISKINHQDGGAHRSHAMTTENANRNDHTYKHIEKLIESNIELRENRIHSQYAKKVMTIHYGGRKEEKIKRTKS